MEWRSHMAIGAAGGFAIAPVIGIHSLQMRIVSAAVMSVAANIPDLDHPGSKIAKAFPPVTTFLCWLLRHLSRLLYLSTRSKKDRKARGTHRYFSHTAIGGLFFGAIAWAIGRYGAHSPLAWMFGLQVVIGCWLHCFADDLTESSISFFWPISIGGQRWARVGPPMWMRFATGDVGEDRAVGVVLGLCSLTIPGMWAHLWLLSGLIAERIPV